MNYYTVSNPIQIPVNHNLVGTCGSCGGRIISPMYWAGSGPVSEWCMDCGKHPKPIVYPIYGPVREMK